ncbi:DUF4126 family protein [Anaeromyxobacter oryzae]|uniref:DUF4126 domain-containing protein n=1 Tax=Anaeromyxobacter oryzae TaxID=2918170 RepID=A0ABM7WRM6_9BACT|nr:DUF4126 family protein [Anaeromyxobacter oryzae]BDG02122.1 hypothetical protein AMOR_11180 [Anaeromyxobacter oryzae]
MDGTSFLLSAGAGWLAGMRSMTAPAAAAFRLRRRVAPPVGAARLLAPPAARWVLPVLALGEMAADKRPGIGDRTAAPSLAARATSGALTAAAIAGGRRLRRARTREMLGAAALGACFAVLSSYANLWLRRAASRRTGASEQTLGYAEDVLAAGLGTAVATL